MIPVNEPCLQGNEKKYLIECIDSGWISSEGPYVKKFEKEFAGLTHRNHAIAVCNGTAALEVAVAALGIGPGDEVIMPTFTIISCALAIIRSGATPVLVDSEPDTWNMSVESISEKITSRTKAIMVVHMYGLPAQIDKICQLAEEKELFVIEDAAHMHGQEYHGKPCGSFGDISIFSFYPNKVVTSGEGGMVVTDNPELAEKTRSLINLAFGKTNRFAHEEMGWNFRMSNLQAAVGLAQLENIESFIHRKKEIGNRYQQAFSDLTSVQLPMEKFADIENTYWVFGLVLDEQIPFDAASAMERLNRLSIGTRPFFWPMHLQPAFNKKGMFINEKYPVSEKLSTRGFYIPSGLGLTDEQQDTVISAVREIILG